MSLEGNKGMKTKRYIGEVPPEGELFAGDYHDQVNHWFLVVAECKCSRWLVAIPPHSNGSFGKCGYCKGRVRRGN